MRVQIVRGLAGSEFGGAPTSQILLFFEGFPAAEAMNFVLRPTDTYERVDGKHGASREKEKDREREREGSPATGGSAVAAVQMGDGRFGVRLVDAKFSLPNADFEEKEKERRKERERAEKEGRAVVADGKRESGGGGGGAGGKEREKESSLTGKWRMSRASHSTPDANAYTAAEAEELHNRALELGLDKAVGVSGAGEAEALRRRFVHLDDLEFADMHDDVFIGFGSEQGES